MSKIYDITIYMSEDMPAFPGDEKVFSVEDIMSVTSGDPYSIKKLTMLTHTGTHIDAPCHYIPDAKSIDELDLSKFIGLADVIEIQNTHCITLDDIKNHSFDPGIIALFKTNNSTIWQKNISFYENYIYLTQEAAAFLVEKNVKTVGIDYLSIDPYGEHIKPLTHLTLLNNNIPIIEGLDLSNVPQGRYKFTCLPLKIAGIDGSPARAILEEL